MEFYSTNSLLRATHDMQIKAIFFILVLYK